MNLSEYLEQHELNKNDPDYQIENFWYGFKNSMKNFYKSNGLKMRNIQMWSDKLNEYKKEKNYSLIEQSIKEYITIYAVDIMKLDKLNDCFHSSILAINIKRWNKMSNKFHFGNSKKYEQIMFLFDGFNCVKNKMDNKLYPILELFRDFDAMIVSEFENLIMRSLELGQCKMLDCINKIIGYTKIVKIINEQYSEFINDRDNNTCGYKLCKRYNKLYN